MAGSAEITRYFANIAEAGLGAAVVARAIRRAVPKIYRGAHLPHRNIVELRAARVRVEADPPFQIEADGEMLGTTPATFAIVPTPIRLKV